MSTALEEKLIRRRIALDLLPPPEARRLIRTRAGATLSDIATELGVTIAAVSAYEHGRRTPRGRLLDAYVRVLADLALLGETGADS